ncbi:UDP-N-acetylmuramoyl-L-alanine--D-glutamate ligase [Planctobacterium marinum]|uniref:UDP-N-acetylmuramoyl-L-alanine--D-glutamate ligase n=1 Tax=Planctobacterium marinum TaxID=1631968 RepID=UPI001E6431EE|nr:UDP-N-acetylmuramoyl-L-alanine--D-glutamate ligase [Planctobacterium marinum]MCC2605386.1 UDP-N-acetylmuramoyl-L-alanine--D-glutamate ligase [Planctobacterium marinum]
MNLSQLKDKKIAIVGMGLSGQSCARFLLRHGIQATGFDTRSLTQSNLDIPCHFGAFATHQFDEFDLIVLSPGMALSTPAIQSAIANGCQVVGDIALFAANCDKPIIGVTGSNGKSTVVSMLEKIWLTAGKKVACGGNIGLPALDLLQTDFDIALLELSSFQLETAKDIPLSAAALLNVSEDHMDRYPDFEAYCQAKHSIFDNADFKLANAQDRNTYTDDVKVDVFITDAAAEHGFGLQMSPAAVTLDGKPYLMANDLKISGVHNLLNAQAAMIIARHSGIADEFIQQALREFDGLPHRCQLVSDRNNVRWINDSKATNVGATIAAIHGLRPVVSGDLWLLAGGDAKQADVTPLQNLLLNDVQHLITFGKDGDSIAALKDNSIRVESLQKAVQVAAQGARSGDMVLLSPACASLDMFANYQQRGDVFAKAVEALS